MSYLEGTIEKSRHSKSGFLSLICVFTSASQYFEYLIYENIENILSLKKSTANIDYYYYL